MKSKAKIVFMGTPEFACAILNQLYNLPIEVVAVFTQPDRPVGRKKILQAPPIKLLALAHQTKVYQPNKIKDDLETLKTLAPDMIVTCAYGQFLPSAILHIPKFGCVNVHASLLPKYRGGAPIHWALINGEKQTGITLMEMDVKMDAGAIYKQEAIDITFEDTTQTLSKKLEQLGAMMIKDHLLDIIDGKVDKKPQDESQVSYAYNISYQDEWIDFKQDGLAVYNRIRGLIDWPVGYITIDSKKVKIHQATFVATTHSYASGLIVSIDEKALRISVKGGFIDVIECQIEGKSKQPISAIFHGVGKSWINKEVNA